MKKKYMQITLHENKICARKKCIDKCYCRNIKLNFSLMG